MVISCGCRLTEIAYYFESFSGSNLHFYPSVSFPTSEDCRLQGIFVNHDFAGILLSF